MNSCHPAWRNNSQIRLPKILKVRHPWLSSHLVGFQRLLPLFPLSASERGDLFPKSLEATRGVQTSRGSSGGDGWVPIKFAVDTFRKNMPDIFVKLQNSTKNKWSPEPMERKEHIKDRFHAKKTKKHIPYTKYSKTRSKSSLPKSVLSKDFQDSFKNHLPKPYRTWLLLVSPGLPLVFWFYRLLFFRFIGRKPGCRDRQRPYGAWSPCQPKKSEEIFQQLVSCSGWHVQKIIGGMYHQSGPKKKSSYVYSTSFFRVRTVVIRVWSPLDTSSSLMSISFVLPNCPGWLGRLPWPDDSVTQREINVAKSAGG